MPGGLSADSYLNRRLRPIDAENYSAAGILPYRRRGENVEVLLPKERPWNSFAGGYDPIGWNLFGGKRVPRQERSVEATAVRSFLECVGQVEGAPDQETLYGLMQTSFVVWYPMGKFALVVVEVSEDLMSDLPEKYLANRQQSGPIEEYKVLPMGIKKWSKMIDELEWVPGSKLVPAPSFTVSDLLGSMLQAEAFRDFIGGQSDPAKALPAAEAPVEITAPPDGGKAYGKGKGKGKDSGAQGKDGGKGKGGWKGKGAAKGGGGGFKGMGGPGGGMLPGQGMGRMYTSKGGVAMGPMYYAGPSFDQNSAEMQRQLYGEQLYLLVQPLSPSPHLAQKITGMLLELPQNELLLNLTNQEELGKRVVEALEVLKEDGIM